MPGKLIFDGRRITTSGLTLRAKKTEQKMRLYCSAVDKDYTITEEDHDEIMNLSANKLSEKHYK